ncbi:uncharacterized protein LOC120727964 [Simochromis diagramma]|uniref:uncharacterized protein LOC120727964 n=1 Tax=Simochromis diagramma TaxID=43689 RepID=UPI001A7ED786|nr:uncharacterized protein LOC120727964 [Simochromis diagramma]
MKHTLLCFIFLTALQDGNTGLVKAQTLTHRAEEGGNITVACNFYLPGSRKLFSSTTSTPNGTLRPFSASVFLSSASTPPTAQSLSSTSGSSTPSSASSGSSDVLIYVRLIVVIIISAFLAISLIFYMMKRTAKPKGPPVKSERADITQGNNVYIEIREVDRQSSSPPAEVSSTDAAPKTSNQMEMKTIDLYSLSTSPHNKVHASSADHTADASPHMSKNICSDAADESLVANR